VSEAPNNAEAEVVETAVVEGAAPEITQDDGPSFEDRALTMGWTPKAQFKGDPEKWVDAETFVKRGEEFLPFLKANNRRLEQALERTRSDLAKLAEFHSKTAEREYQRAMKDIEAKIAEATAAGDTQGVMDAADELADLRADAKATAKPQASAEDETFEAWKAENPWYGEDTAMTAAANAIGNELFNQGMSGKAQADEVTRRIKAEFPHKFKNPNRSAPAAVEGGSVARGRGGKSRSDLPADARQFMDRMVKQGLMTEAEYIKDYFG
jgi:hypothetical protein